MFKINTGGRSIHIQNIFLKKSSAKSRYYGFAMTRRFAHHLINAHFATANLIASQNFSSNLSTIAQKWAALCRQVFLPFHRQDISYRTGKSVLKYVDCGRTSSKVTKSGVNLSV